MGDCGKIDFSLLLPQKWVKKALKWALRSWIGIVWLDMARFGSWVIVEPKFVKNNKVESLISRSLGGSLKLTTRGRVGFYYSFQTSFDHNLAIQKHAIPNQNILSPFLGLFDPFFGQK